MHAADPGRHRETWSLEDAVGDEPVIADTTGDGARMR